MYVECWITSMTVKSYYSLFHHYVFNICKPFLPIKFETRLMLLNSLLLTEAHETRMSQVEFFIRKPLAGQIIRRGPQNCQTPLQ